MRTLSQKATKRIMDFEGKDYRPKEIVDLEKKIVIRTKKAQIDAIKKQRIDKDKVKEIIKMNLRLNNLYMDWAEEKLS